VLWQNGQVINLGSLGGAMNNDPEAINDLGEITGDSDLPGDATGHAFLWRKGKMQDLGTLPGDYSSYANSINNLSQIVGQSCDINGNCRPFLWENGKMIDLNTLVPASQANLYYPATIDDLGVIGGIAMNQSTGLDPAFVALPTFGLTGKQVSAGRIEAAPRLSMPQGTRLFVQRRLKHSAAAPIATNHQ
jgi:probable HAF family extracellular repeat protein